VKLRITSSTTRKAATVTATAETSHPATEIESCYGRLLHFEADDPNGRTKDERNGDKNVKLCHEI
jgi:hypothetical protein